MGLNLRCEGRASCMGGEGRGGGGGEGRIGKVL